MSKDLTDVLLEILKEIKEDLKDVKENISTIKIVQAEQAIVLEEHQKASTLNGERLNQVETEVIPKLVEKLTPKPRDYKKAISWHLGIFVTILTLVGGVGKLAGWF